MLKMPQIPHWRSKHLFGEDVWPTVHFLYLSLFLKNHFHIKTHELNGNRIGKTVEYAEKNYSFNGCTFATKLQILNNLSFMEMPIILVFIKLSIMSAFGRKIQENEGRGGRGVAFFFSFELHYCLTFHMPLYYLKKKIKLWKSVCCLYHSIHAYLVNVTELNILWPGASAS